MSFPQKICSVDDKICGKSGKLAGKPLKGSENCGKHF